MTAVRVRAWAAWLITSTTMAASVSGLWHVAFDVAHMGELGSLAIVAGFDVTAVLAGLKVAERPREIGGWLSLIGLALLSAAAQIAASEPGLEWWRLMHGAPPVIAIWTLHGAVSEGKGRKGHDTKRAPGATPKKDRGGRSGVSAATSPAPALPPAEARAPMSIKRDPRVTDIAEARRKGGQPAKGTAARPLTDEQRAQSAADALAAEGIDATRRDVERVLVVGNRVAARLLPRVKELMSEKREAESGS